MPAPTANTASAAFDRLMAELLRRAAARIASADRGEEGRIAAMTNEKAPVAAGARETGAGAASSHHEPTTIVGEVSP